MRCRSCQARVGILDEHCQACGADLTDFDLRGPRRKRAVPAFAELLAEQQREAGRAQAQRAPPTQALPGVPGLFARVRARELDVCVEGPDCLNLGLLVNEIPLLTSLRIRNEADEALEDGRVRVWVAPECGEAWEETLPYLPPGELWAQAGITPPVDLDYLVKRREAESGALRLEVLEEERVLFAASRPLQIHAANEWIYLPEREWTLASYVFPNHRSVENLLSLARPHLEKAGFGTAFDGYQSDEPRKVRAMLESVHQALLEDVELSYVNPPASFERTSQKVFLPGDIERHRRGTCLDLALLFAGALERMGLAPLVVLIPGHAFTAVWTHEPRSLAPLRRSAAQLRKALKEGRLIAVETTACAQGIDTQMALLTGGSHLLEQPLLAVIDVLGARHHGARPIAIPEVNP